jgi:pyruvate/2-oxoglutarate dehydrogenase complex dihydrolipoamide acyltransferase (E2) component
MVISAPHAGKVGSVQIKEGDSVGGSDLICKIVKPGEKYKSGFFGMASELWAMGGALRIG